MPFEEADAEEQPIWKSLKMHPLHPCFFSNEKNEWRERMKERMEEVNNNFIWERENDKKTNKRNITKSK